MMIDSSENTPETRESTLKTHQSHFEAYRDALRQNHQLDIFSCHGDGNCLFRSISHQVYGTENYHLLVRAKCVKYMSYNEDHFGPSCQALRGSGGSFEAYLLTMSRDAREAGELAWGDYPEIGALAEIYGRQIEIWTYDSAHGGAHLQDHCCFGCGFDANASTSNARPPIRLSFFKGGHYDSITGEGWHDSLSRESPGYVEDKSIALARTRGPGQLNAAIQASREEALRAFGATVDSLAGSGMDGLIMKSVLKDSEREHVEDELLAQVQTASAAKFREEQERLESQMVADALKASVNDQHKKQSGKSKNNSVSAVVAPNKSVARTAGSPVPAFADQSFHETMVSSAVDQVCSLGLGYLPVGLIKHALRNYQSREGNIDVEAAVSWLYSDGERYLSQNLHLYKVD
jgi:OTU domain-containing protein 5